MAVESLERTLAEPNMFGDDGQATFVSVEKFLRRQAQGMQFPYIPLLLYSLPAIFAVAKQLPDVISGPRITFRNSPLCITFGFYIRGHHSHLGETLVGYTGDETLVRYSIFPINH